MAAVLLDTHVWAWTLLGRRKLTTAALAANDSADTRYLSPISLYEIARKVRLGKWPEMERGAPYLKDLAEKQGLEFARIDGEIGLRAGMLNWAHRDPFDRMLAATALVYGVPIISADQAFDGVVNRIW